MTAPLLQGVTALVTGAGGGLGRGMAIALAAHGANTVVTGRRPDTAVRVAEEIARMGGIARAIGCDVSDRGQVEDSVALAVREFGGLDVLIHNATSSGSSRLQDLATLPLDVWADLAAVSLRGSFHCAQVGFPHLSRRSGSLILLTSVEGIEGSSDRPAYATVKAAQRGLVKSLAREWGPAGIRVNCVAPAGASAQTAQAFAENAGFEDVVMQRIPLGWFGDPVEDIGAAVVFLASPLSRYVTGQTLAVDGGLFLGL